jgi:hypothetical protein
MGIPALEAMHAGLTRKHRKVSERLHDPIDAGLQKVVEYYDRTGASDAYLCAMSIPFFYTLFFVIT